MLEKIIKDVLAALPSKRVLVLGDVMLDEYIWGEVQRISPEAPVPVVKTLRRTYRPGGTGNVAANVAALGGLPLLVSLIGQDPMGTLLVEALLQRNVRPLDGLIPLSDRPTTVKTRVLAHNQQMLRLDTEINLPVSEQVEDAILSWIEKYIDQVDVCVISDYAKGLTTERVCQGLIKMARDLKLPIVVDPKGRNYSKYAGATVVTPNVHEALGEIDGLADTSADLDQRAEYLVRHLAGTSVLVTRGAEGMSLYGIDRPSFHFPAKARIVFDVTGAGDTVAATLALALAVGLSLDQAVALANLAAGVVVGKLGTATVTREELLEAVEAPVV